MTKSHALPFLIVAALSSLASQVAFSAERAPVTFETWTCKGDGSGNVKSLVVNVDQLGRTSSGQVTDPGIRSTPISVQGSDEGLYLLSGAYYGHDSIEYTVELSPESFDFSADSSSLKAIGSATISYTGNIDCVGEVSGVEKLTCEVTLTR